MKRAFALALALGVLPELGCQPALARDRQEPTGATQTPEGTPSAPAERLLLSGELDTVAAANLVVPRTPQWNIALRWLASDGVTVHAGEPVAELDNTFFAGDLADKKLAAARAASDLAHQLSADAITRADKTFELDKARSALAVATLQASVDRSVYPLRVYQEKQVERERAQAAFDKAKDELAAHIQSSALEAKVRQIALDKSRREIQAAETAIEQLVLRAPRDGLVVVANHPWFGRKIQLGDNVWVGVPIVRLPDLKTLHVNAWLSDVDDGRIAVGEAVACYLDAYPELAFAGSITEISPVAREPSRDSWRRSFLVTVALEQIDLERMRPGMSVRVEVATQPAAKSAG